MIEGSNKIKEIIRNVGHNIIKIIEERGLKRFEPRMRSNRVLKIILEWNSEGRKRKGNLGNMGGRS